jgi:hypothetical protein
MDGFYFRRVNMKRNKTILATVLLAFAVLSVGVIASVTDTDGGFNPQEKGTCIEEGWNATDFCIGSGNLIEYYPMLLNGTQEYICAGDWLVCECSDGACPDY